jgi:hypothetical protein
MLLLLLLLRGTFELLCGEICVAPRACVFWHPEMVVSWSAALSCESSRRRVIVAEWLVHFGDNDGVGCSLGSTSVGEAGYKLW